MSVLIQLTVPGEVRPLKIAPEAIYTSSFLFCSVSHVNIDIFFLLFETVLVIRKYKLGLQRELFYDS